MKMNAKNVKNAKSNAEKDAANSFAIRIYKVMKSAAKSLSRKDNFASNNRKRKSKNKNKTHKPDKILNVKNYRNENS